MYRVALITQLGEVKAFNCYTIDEAYEILLKHDLKKYRILDKERGTLIETEKGKRGDCNGKEN